MFLYNIVRQVCDIVMIENYENHLSGCRRVVFCISERGVALWH